MLLLVSLLLLLLGVLEGLPRHAWREVTGNLTAHREAADHFMRIERRGCAAPVARLFPVASFGEEFQEFEGFYRPHCVELFRCTGDSGCCRDDLQCGPAAEEVVHLPLSVVAPGAEPRVFLVPFLNHTRCECFEENNWIDERR